MWGELVGFCIKSEEKVNTVCGWIGCGILENKEPRVTPGFGMRMKLPFIKMEKDLCGLIFVKW